VDVLVVSVPTTAGWRAAALELVAALRRCGARVELAEGRRPRPVRTFALTDLAEAWSARQAAVAGIDAHAPAGVIYCSMTAALLWPRPGGVFLDSIAAENRPGRHGVWQRVVERRRLQAAPVLLTMSERSLDPLRGEHARAVVVPSPVEPSGLALAAEERDIDVIVYAGDPVKRRLDLVLAVWEKARRDGETLVVAGTDRLAGSPAGVQLAGRMPPDRYRELLRRARVFVAAPQREDYGIAPLEALADGCILVTTPSPGPYPALAIARELDSRLVSDDLAGALRCALDDPRTDYVEAAERLLAPFRRAAVDATVSQDVLPRLLSGWAAK
jgi:hypothetical protein